MLKRAKRKIVYRDCDLESLKVLKCSNIRELIIAELVNDLEDCFNEVVVYHACRTDDVDSYYKKGVVPLSLVQAQDKLRAVFSDVASESDFIKAIEKIKTTYREGYVYASLDPRHIQANCGHYLIYGSEYLGCLSTNLPRSILKEPRDRLKETGKAAFIKCIVSIHILSDLECLASAMIADHCYRIAHEREDVHPIRYCIATKSCIPSDCVIGHIFPAKIWDPYKQRCWDDVNLKYDYTISRWDFKPEMA
ncbi:hypothetical protein [Ruficoccus sp. ZRK36]|uniref:hypothetical protein n=1 Tax=Ruficoccus sp. ZRK36 TaxID=2866311 RepID=UPI001C72D4B8|nr:hypothetical protein [Ruficoccus sp. ZRK36]QYY34933.1 hypothetical protein K0V07_11545 [Ruficoccus sp. ZRK36]